MTNDSILKIPVMRCALESRTHAVCQQILDAVKAWTLPMDKTLRSFFTENNGTTILFAAIRTGNVETVRFLVENKVTIANNASAVHRRIIATALHQPEILDLICEPSNMTAFTQLFCQSVNEQTLYFCEPSLRILQSKGSAIFKAGPQQMQVMADIITCPGANHDPGALVMNARLLRSLILMGEPLSAANQDELTDAAISHRRFYMFTFLAAMGVGSNLKKYMRFIAEPERSSIEQALDRY
jgi:hypothetical protein